MEQMKKPCPDCGQDCDPCEGMDKQPWGIDKKRGIQWYCANPNCDTTYWDDKLIKKRAENKRKAKLIRSGQVDPRRRF